MALKDDKPDKESRLGDFHPNGVRRCGVAGCPLPGTWSPGGDTWWCWVHTQADGLQTHAITQRLRQRVWIAKLYAYIEGRRLIDKVPVEALAARLEQLGRLDLAPEKGERRRDYATRLRQVLYREATDGVHKLHRESSEPTEDESWKRLCAVFDAQRQPEHVGE